MTNELIEPTLIEDHGLIGCPHCGKAPTVTLHPGHSHRGSLAGFIMAEVGDSYAAECCGGMMADNLQELSEWWNRRVQVGELATQAAEVTGEYMIWSNEHGAWWRPNARGYTKIISSAGRYSREEATAICDSANLLADEAQPHEVMVLAPAG